MQYYELEPENNTFHTLLADVTHRCNMNCANCYIPNRLIPDMDADELKSFLKRLPNRTDVRLIGAEATMRDDLPELIRMIRSIGHHPALLTNGLKLYRYDYTKSLWDAGLRSLGLSMNAADNDDIYRIIDGGKYSKLKVGALENCFRVGLVTHINCILAKGTNETITPKRLYDLVVEKGIETGRKFKRTYPVMLRFKSVGEIGRYMEDTTMNLEELVGLISEALDVDPDYIKSQNHIDGYAECNSVLFQKDTPNGPIWIKITDWSIDDDGVPDSGSKRRGRITQNWKVAPFFEHVKLNEFGY